MSKKLREKLGDEVFAQIAQGGEAALLARAQIAKGKFEKVRAATKELKEWYVMERDILREIKKLTSLPEQPKVPERDGWKCAGQVWLPEPKPCEGCERCNTPVNKIVNGKKYTMCKSCESKKNRVTRAKRKRKENGKEKKQSKSKKN